MSNVILEARCYEHGCGGVMEGRRGEYKYVESGLNSVLLKDILVFHCTKCNAVVPEIPAPGVLHRVIALRLLRKENMLTGHELRFLRKLCGYSINEFSEILGTSKSVVSRWENGTHGQGTERIVRLLVLANLVREMAGLNPILKNVTVEQLNGEVQSALKLITSRAGNERYEISPEEIARFGGSKQDNTKAIQKDCAVVV